MAKLKQIVLTAKKMGLKVECYFDICQIKIDGVIKTTLDSVPEKFKHRNKLKKNFFKFSMT